MDGRSGEASNAIGGDGVSASFPIHLLGEYNYYRKVSYCFVCLFFFVCLFVLFFNLTM